MNASPDSDALLERMARDGVIPVVTIEDAADAKPLAAALAAGGCGSIEITLRTAAALEALTSLAGDPGVFAGAGTVLNAAQVRAAHAAGARFIVSPGLDPAVVDTAQALGLPVFPGVSTASEIQAAWNLGLRIVKFFPAHIAGGAAAIRAFVPVFPDMRFTPTGGVNEANLGDYLGIAAVMACGGSWLAPADLLAAGDFAEVSRRTAAAIAIAQAARRSG